MKIPGFVIASLGLVGLGFAPPSPVPHVEEGPLLTPGAKVVLKVRQVLPKDGLSRGERLLNGLAPLQAGDVFTAELVGSPSRMPMILAGCVDSVTPPGRFGRPGKVAVKIAWPVGPDGVKAGQWAINIEDQRFTSFQRRAAITGLFLLEGITIGAGIGTQLDRAKSASTLIGGGAGLLLSVAYASLQPGQVASLEPGDRLSVVVGKTGAKKIPPDLPLTVFPVHEHKDAKHKRKKP